MPVGALDATMLTSGPNQYLQPDYLSPLPTTLDAKKSPLALLAQTCSQIGADSPPKPLGQQDKPSAGKKHSSSASSGGRPGSSERPGPSPAANKRASPSTSSSSAACSPPAASPSQPQQSKLAFKPYEANVLSRRDDRPPSKTGSEAGSAGGAVDEHRSKSTGSAAAARKSTSPRTATSSPPTSKSAAAASSPSASPLIRSGLEVMQGHGKDPLGAFKAAAGMAGLAGLSPAQLAQLCCPPGYEAHHPAFRPPFAGGSPFSQHHAAALLAAGYHNNPYFSYQRVKSATGVETIVPICKDPFCQGCQYSLHNTMLGLGAPCPPGCTTCEHHKYSSLYSPAAAAAAAAAMQGRPYVCSWIAGASYCGKRFGSSDELLQHLRSHTGPSPAGGGAAGLPGGPLGSGLPSPGAYSRYHPYAKPGGPGASPTGLLPPSASPYAAFSPQGLSPAGLSPAGLSGMPLSPYAYSPYALYGQRLGAAVHP